MMKWNDEIVVMFWILKASDLPMIKAKGQSNLLCSLAYCWLPDFYRGLGTQKSFSSCRNSLALMELFKTTSLQKSLLPINWTAFPAYWRWWGVFPSLNVLLYSTSQSNFFYFPPKVWCNRSLRWAICSSHLLLDATIRTKWILSK